MVSPPADDYGSRSGERCIHGDIRDKLWMLSYVWEVVGHPTDCQLVSLRMETLRASFFCHCALGDASRLQEQRARVMKWQRYLLVVVVDGGSSC